MPSSCVNSVNFDFEKLSLETLRNHLNSAFQPQAVDLKLNHLMFLSTGILMTYLTAITFLLKPSPVSCYVSSLGFHLSVTVLYTALLLKTHRVYRIFNSGKRGKIGLKWIGPSSQLLFTFLLITLQVIT